MSIRMSEGTCEHRPIGIAAHVGSLPAGFVLIVKTHRDILIRRFSIDHRFDWTIGPCRVHIHPVVLFGIIRDWIVFVTHPLTILAVSALEHMEIHPRRLCPPLGRSVSPTRMIGHQVVLVDSLDGSGQGIPLSRVDIALDVTTHDPDDIGLILIAVGQESTIELRLFHVHQSCLHQSTPNGHHTYIYTILCSGIDDIVHVVPVAIDTLLVDFREVPSIRVRHLSVMIIGRYAVDHLYLYHIISGLPTTLEIIGSLSPVCAFRQKPARLSLPEERCTIIEHQETLVVRHLQFPVFPRFPCPGIQCHKTAEAYE